MILLADEGVERIVVDRLRRDGHDLRWIAEESPGASDEAVLQTAATSGRLLVTNDKDFGELVFRQRRAANGVLLVRLFSLALETRADRVAEALRAHGPEMSERYSVLDPGALRIRTFSP